jgi:antitoxin PrlF
LRRAARSISGARDGSIVLVRTDERRPANRFSKLRGHAGEGLGTDAIMALTRGEA